MQEIARLFGSLGFKVDTTGLDTFRQNIKLARTDIANLGRDAKTSSNSLNALSRNITNVANKLDKVSVKKANDVLTNSYTNVSKSVGKVDTAFLSISNNQKNITKALGKIHASVKAGEPIWDKYRASVIATRDALSQVNGKMKELRKNSTVSLRTTGVGGSRTTGSYGKRNISENPVKEGIQDFFRSMTPATLMGGGLAGAGFIAKEIVQRGRAQQQMERSLQFATKDMDEFSSALKYVREEALRLGLSSATLGKTFATVSGSAEGKMSQPEIKSMFTKMSEYFVSVHAGEYEKSLMYLAIQQMFSIGKIQGQEIGQLTGTGLITRAQLNTAIREVYDLKDNSQIESLQKAGKLDPAKVLQQLFGNLSKRAHESGAFEGAMQSSVVKQGQAVEQLNQLSQQIMEGGLDKLLADILGQLVSLVTVLRDIQSGFQGVKKSLDAVSGGNGGAIISFTLLALLLVRNFKILKNLIGGFINFRKIGIAVTALLRGRFGLALKSTGKFFGWWKWLIVGVLVALDRLGAKLSGRSNEWTWVDDIIAQFELMGGEIDLALLKLQLFAHNSKLSLDPTWWSNGKGWVVRDYGDKKGADLSTTKGIIRPDLMKAQIKAEADKNSQAVKKIQQRQEATNVIPKKTASIVNLNIPIANTINVGNKTYTINQVHSKTTTLE